MTWKFYHNPQCSKSREALLFLQNQNVVFEIVEYLKAPLQLEELRVLIQQLNNPLAALVRSKESDFLADPFDINSEEVVIQKLTKNPRLMERPILQGNGQAAIGRPLKNFLSLLSK